MESCTKCNGFIPHSLAFCPNCDSSLKPASFSAVKKVGAILGGAAVSMTLMACYGAPAMDDFSFPNEPVVECDPELDPECPPQELRPLEIQ